MDLLRRDNRVPNNGPRVETVSLVLVALSILTVGARLYRRLGKSGSSFGWDDAAISFALTLAIGHTITDVIGKRRIAQSPQMGELTKSAAVEKFGFGKHEVDLPPSLAHSHKADLLFWVAQLFYKSCILCTKESICFLYLRLFNVGHRRFRIAVIVSMIFIALYYIIAILITVFECTPVQKSWEKQLPGSCIDLQTFFFANAAFNVITDILVMALPIPAIAKLQITRKQRIGLGLIFFVGLVATATSIVRMTTLHAGGENNDVSWTTSGSTIWSSIEMNVAIICACLFILRVPLQSILPRVFGRRTTGFSRTIAEETPGAVGGGCSRITTSGAIKSKDVEELEMGAVGGKGMVFGETMTPGGESGSEDERYFLGDEESVPGVEIAVARGEAPPAEKDQEVPGHRRLETTSGTPGGIVKITD
ncbi:MAG: hypothetical protein Q9179_006454, partial [Wetmoreana sp. 5 TL-2023]